MYWKYLEKCQKEFSDRLNVCCDKKWLFKAEFEDEFNNKSYEISWAIGQNK